MAQLVSEYDVKGALNYLSQVALNIGLPENRRKPGISLYSHVVNPKIDTVQEFLNNAKHFSSSKGTRQLADAGMSLLQHYRVEREKSEPNPSLLQLYCSGISNVIDSLTE